MSRVNVGSLPLVLGVVMAVTGCGNRTEEKMSSMEFGIGGGDFAGNSIRICGARNPAADGKFRCDSVLPPDSSSVSVPGPTSEDCPCFDFNSDGTLVDPTTMAPVT